MEGCCTTNQGQLLLTMAKGAEAPAAAQAAARAAYETRKGGLEDRRIERSGLATTTHSVLLATGHLIRARQEVHTSRVPLSPVSSV
jgi:hypothetical protein